MGREPGFTLVELLIVIAIIAIIAAIAIPNLLSSRITSNETAAVATLRAISSAQAQFQATTKADVDGNGMGEFGSFRELSGAVNVREGTAAETTPLFPPVVSTAFRNPDANGGVQRSGYYFKIYLPDSAGHGISPDATGSYSEIQATLAETTWCCYAWPARYGKSGNRVFMTNQAGDIISSEYEGYSGSANDPSPGAGFIAGGHGSSITGLAAVGTTGRDGRVWRQVN